MPNLIAALKSKLQTNRMPEELSYDQADHSTWNEFPLGIDSNGRELFWNPCESSHLLLSGYHGTSIIPNLIQHGIDNKDEWDVFGVDYRRIHIPNFPHYQDKNVGIAETVEDALEILRYLNDELLFRTEQLTGQDGKSSSERSVPSKSLLAILPASELLFYPTGNKTDEGKAEDDLRQEASYLVEKLSRLGAQAGIYLVLGTDRPNHPVVKGTTENFSARVAIGRVDAIKSVDLFGNDNAANVDYSVRGRGYYQDSQRETEFQAYTGFSNIIRIGRS